LLLRAAPQTQVIGTEGWLAGASCVSLKLETVLQAKLPVAEDEGGPAALALSRKIMDLLLLRVQRCHRR